MVGSVLHREVQVLLLAIVPIAHAIEVAVADIVASNLANSLSVALDFTVDIVLFFEHVSAVVDVGCQVVRLIFELLPSLALMTELAHEEAIYFVPVVIEDDFTAIREGHCPLTNVVDISALQSGFYAPFHYAAEVIVGVVDDEA